MSKRVALIKFPRGSFDQEYSYFTDIEDLRKDDVVVVPASTTYSIGVFQRYTSNNTHIKNATKWVVEKVDISAYEEKIFMGLYD